MTLRDRITVLAAAAVAAGIALVAAIVFVAEHSESIGQVDAKLRSRAAALSATASQSEVGGTGPTSGYARVVHTDGTTTVLGHDDVPVPLDERAVAVAAGRADRFTTDLDGPDQAYRVLTVPLGSDAALQVAAPLGEVRRHLWYLAAVLSLVAVGSLAVAVGLGRFVASTALRPVHHLSAGVQRVTRTRDLSTRVDVHGKDELGRLGAAFNAMLEELEHAHRSQRRLVSDASHELLTPLASVQANVEVLDETTDLDPCDRRQIVGDLRTEVADLVTTVDSLLDLARNDERRTTTELLALEDLVSDTVEWAARRYPQIRIEANLKPHVVAADRSLVQRAVGNLVDNAAKWTPTGGIVEVRLADGVLTVRDHGPGIDASDLPHVFERFYRAPTARALPGAGLGLAIVREVADAHGWAVTIGNDPHGGCVVELAFDAKAANAATEANPTHRRPRSVLAVARAAAARPEARASALLTLVAVVPLLVAVGAPLLARDEQPHLRTVAGTLERCGDRYCVDQVVVDFGPAWYVDGARARHDYDRDGTLGTLAKELAGLLGRDVTLETDGGPLDDDVFTLDGMAVRSPDGELPPPTD